MTAAVIRCADKLCPWSVEVTNPDAGGLAAEHATEHEGGRRSNVQATRAAAESRSLRHAGDRRWAEPA